LLFEHDLFGKPLRTFPDHALADAETAAGSPDFASAFALRATADKSLHPGYARSPLRRSTQLSLVTCRADFERRLGELGHEPLKMHDPLSGQLFMQLGNLLGFGDQRVAHLFRVLHLKLKGLDG